MSPFSSNPFPALKTPWCDSHSLEEPPLNEKRAPCFQDQSRTHKNDASNERQQHWPDPWPFRVTTSPSPCQARHSSRLKGRRQMSQLLKNYVVQVPDKPTKTWRPPLMRLTPGYSGKSCKGIQHPALQWNTCPPSKSNTKNTLGATRGFEGRGERDLFSLSPSSPFPLSLFALRLTPLSSLLMLMLMLALPTHEKSNLSFWKRNRERNLTDGGVRGNDSPGMVLWFHSCLSIPRLF